MRDDPRSHQPYNIACPAPRHTNPYIFLTESHTRAKAHLLVSYATQKRLLVLDIDCTTPNDFRFPVSYVSCMVSLLSSIATNERKTKKQLSPFHTRGS